jgi:hypothetical protein
MGWPRDTLMGIGTTSRVNFEHFPITLHFSHHYPPPTCETVSKISHFQDPGGSGGSGVGLFKLSKKHF